ncbi:Inner membrane component of T3SS domain-containing protein [Quadrisphaera granulorum]|uniref:Type III secretion system (T3SS) inner membrane Yop/YscD-like protein n=1 Tax=Quadrisphaera granulorum TaxID=317664 RepID=A0A316ADP5_9ACTN|nr:FHA domain-containing protein [Quadrisphaera granulorum]PWJ55741.1 type III secretion system (T3SS) inner membrane Yop/YscD-like protein [Quadrisphaera granulorum]SZE95238.1 Inner membrane component of T3SS domain-containing protein [Quadrisphaera granulorum]
MSQLTVTVLQLGLLVLLWLFVLGVVTVLRRDLFGARAPRQEPAAAVAAPDAPARQPVQQPAASRPAPAPERRPETPRLVLVTEGPRSGTRLELGSSPILLGRSDDCTLVLGDDYASGHHARLAPSPQSPGGWVVEDLGSTNGTTVGRGSAAVPVRGAVPVGVGSVVRVGRTTLELRA